MDFDVKPPQNRPHENLESIPNPSKRRAPFRHTPFKPLLSTRYLQILVPEHIDVFLHFRASGRCFGYFGCFHAIGRKISCRFVISKCQTDDSGPIS